MLILALIIRVSSHDSRNIDSTASPETTSGHGRVETRTCWQTDYLEWFEDWRKWSGLHSVCMIETERTLKKTGETSRERRFFISSLGVDPLRQGD